MRAAAERASAPLAECGADSAETCGKSTGAATTACGVSASRAAAHRSGRSGDGSACADAAPNDATASTTPKLTRRAAAWIMRRSDAVRSFRAEGRARELVERQHAVVVRVELVED